MLRANDKEEEAVRIEEFTNRLKVAKKIQLQIKAVHNKAMQKEAVLHSCEAKMAVALQAEEVSNALVAAGEPLQLREIVALADLISKHRLCRLTQSDTLLCSVSGAVVSASRRKVLD